MRFFGSRGSDQSAITRLILDMRTAALAVPEVSNYAGKAGRWRSLQPASPTPISKVGPEFCGTAAVSKTMRRRFETPGYSKGAPGRVQHSSLFAEGERSDRDFRRRPPVRALPRPPGWPRLRHRQVRDESLKGARETRGNTTNPAIFCSVRHAVVLLSLSYSSANRRGSPERWHA
jgi:hypothetical protein